MENFVLKKEATIYQDHFLILYEKYVSYIEDMFKDTARKIYLNGNVFDVLEEDTLYLMKKDLSLSLYMKSQDLLHLRNQILLTLSNAEKMFKNKFAIFTFASMSEDDYELGSLSKEGIYYSFVNAHIQKNTSYELKISFSKDVIYFVDKMINDTKMISQTLYSKTGVIALEIFKEGVKPLTNKIIEKYQALNYLKLSPHEAFEKLENNYASFIFEVNSSNLKKDLIKIKTVYNNTFVKIPLEEVDDFLEKEKHHINDKLYKYTMRIVYENFIKNDQLEFAKKIYLCNEHQFKEDTILKPFMQNTRKEKCIFCENQAKKLLYKVKKFIPE